MEINYLVICQYSSNWEIPFYFYTLFVIILHFVALVLAFLTLKAKSDALNDYHYINTAIIFVTSACYLLVFIPQIALSEYASLTAFLENLIHFH